MQDWINYYKLLQIDHIAEPEVVEGAYKRLARKYHPDINKSLDAESLMKLLNEAYSVLTDPARRSEYDLEWEEKQKVTRMQINPVGKSPVDDKLAVPAKNVLVRYFSLIMNKNFKEAYDLISTADKKHIGPEDFFKWQSTVSKIFKLKLFECEVERWQKNVRKMRQRTAVKS